MASSSISALNERLRSSAGKGNWEEIDQLLRHGATFEADKYGRTALHYAAHYGQVKAIRVCIARGCELDKVDSYGCTALHKAIAPDGHVEAVRALLEEGCDVDGQDENGNTCVHEGAMNGFSQSLDVLIKVGKASIHISNKNGQKPIHLACQKGHNQSTRILIKAGSHPNIKNSAGETPLHIACLNGHITCARILISAECDINMKNKEGNTPLHIAAGLGKLKIARLLLESQCEVKVRNKNNQTSLDLARQNNQRDVALLIIGAHRMKKGKFSFFSRNKKDGSRLDGFGNASHHHHHSDSSPNDKHKRKHGDDRRGDDDMDGGQDGLRVRGRREMDGIDRHSSGSSKGKAKKKRDKRRDDGPSQGQNLFVREDMKKQMKSERKLQEEIHLGREMGNPHSMEQGNPHFRTQLFKDKTGKILHVPMPAHCNCTPYIKKLENQVEASKERLLHEIDMSKARFESRMNNLEKRMTHQAQCMDQLCKERIAAERADCIHRIDRRAKEERRAWSEEHDARTDELRKELRHWFESRIQPLHEQLSRTMDDAALETASPTRRTRPRAGFYRLNGREVVTHRKRSKSVGNVSDCDLAEEDDEDSDEESESESEDEEEEAYSEETHGRKNSHIEEHPVSSRQPSEQSPHRYKKTETSKAKDYAKSGAIPKSTRSGSFRQAVSDEDRATGSSSNSGTPLSMVDGTYRPPLIAAHERSPATDSHTLPADFVFPSQETDDTESSESSESETASQQSLETVSYKPKSVSGASSSTRDSGLHTLKGSSVSSDRRSRGPTRADLIAYEALTVNARPPPPLQAQVRPRNPVSTQPPPSELRMRPNYTPPFSPPVSPNSTASQPLSTSTLVSSDTQRVATPSTEQPSSDNPSPTDSGKAQSTSSGISSGETSSHPNSSPIKYNIISPHSGQSYQGTYNPHSSSSSNRPDLFKVIKSENRKTSHDEAPPPYRSSNGVPSDSRNTVAQPYIKNLNNENSKQPSYQSMLSTQSTRNGIVANVSNSFSSSVHHGNSSSYSNPHRISSASDISTGPQKGNIGHPAVPTRSAASRLGVTPSLNPLRGVQANQGVSDNTNSTSGKDASQMHQQPRTQPPQSLPPGYSVMQGRSGSNDAVFAITRTNQFPSGTHKEGNGPANKNNNAAHTSLSTSAGLPGTFAISTSRTFNGQATCGNQYSIPAGASATHDGTFRAPHNNFYLTSGASNGTKGTSSTFSNRTHSEILVSNGTENTDHRISASHSNRDERTSGISNSSYPSMNVDRKSGSAYVSHGASGGVNLISTVERFNRTAAPEQKLKYTREIIL